jgi:hypothetical protein
VYKGHEETKGISQNGGIRDEPERNRNSGSDEQRANLRSRVCGNIYFHLENPRSLNLKRFAVARVQALYFEKAKVKRQKVKV